MASKDVKVKKKPEAKKEESFIDEDDGDKKVIVIIALSILVVVGVLIGFIVGCEKKEEEIPEDEPDIVIPAEPEKEEETEEEEEISDSIETTVVKVAKTTEKVVEKETYQIMYNYGRSGKKRSLVKEEELLEKFTPKGYRDCTFYYDNDYEYEVDFAKPVRSDMEIFMVCEAITYEIVYSNDTTPANPSTYKVEDGNVYLNDVVEANKFFNGWYLDEQFNIFNGILSSDTIDYADDNNVIHLYAKLTDSFNVTFKNNDGSQTFDDIEYTPNNVDNAKYEVEGNACLDGSTILGWTTEENSNTIKYDNGEQIYDYNNQTVYSICGAAVVEYVSEDVTTTVGYTQEEVDDYELPEPEDLGLETPVYYVKVEEKTEDSKVIVDNTIPDEDLTEKEVKLETVEVVNREVDPEVYADDPLVGPKVGDNVLEKEKEFVGWDDTETTPVEPVDDTWTPEVTDPVEKEELEAIWDVQEEDKPVENEDPGLSL